MIKIYSSGNEFYDDNVDFLLTNPYTEVFFRIDAPLLTDVNKKEYVIKCFKDDKTLLILKKEPYNSLVYGNEELIEELLDYLIDNQYEFNDFLCPLDLGFKISSYLENKGRRFILSIGMDFMECHEKHAPSNSLVERATTDDADEIFENIKLFVKECGISLNITKEKLVKNLENYRVVRVGNEIASMATFSKATKDDMKISVVYTKNKYRGKGFSKLIVNNIVNEIIDSGKYATLNVDIKNPISNHIYTSLGFKKVFSQGVFIKEK